LGEDPWGPNRCEMHVELKKISGEEQEKLADELKNTLKKFPGIDYEVMTFLGDRIGETISGETAPVVVNIIGDDLEFVDRKAKEVEEILKSIPGNDEVKIKAPMGAPRTVVRLR